MLRLHIETCQFTSIIYKKKLNEFLVPLRLLHGKFLPIFSIADVEVQKAQRADDTGRCHKPHDYNEWQRTHHKF